MSQATLTAPADAARIRHRAILSCAIGNFFELFDFSIFGFFAGAIGRNFFPGTDPVASLLSSFATFGVGFIMRPVGGLVIGAYSDRYGRKSALVLTVLICSCRVATTVALSRTACANSINPFSMIMRTRRIRIGPTSANSSAVVARRHRANRRRDARIRPGVVVVASLGISGTVSAGRWCRRIRAQRLVSGHRAAGLVLAHLGQQQVGRFVGTIIER